MISEGTQDLNDCANRSHIANFSLVTIKVKGGTEKTSNCRCEGCTGEDIVAPLCSVFIVGMFALELHREQNL